MSTKTEAQLAAAVLQQMGVVDAGETAETADTNLVISAYEDKFAELAGPGLELAYWSMTTIPVPVFTILRDLVINEVQGAFGAPMSPADKNAQEEIILRKLRRHVSVAKSNAPTTAEYF